MNPFTSNFSWLQLAAGISIAAVIGGAAYAVHSLSLSGAAAAVVLGGIIFGLGGLPWAVLLMGFFISSSFLSRMFRREKISVDEKFSKGSRRDALQVLANGGIAGVLVILLALFPQSTWLWACGAASLAAVNADTWATEMGVLSKINPRLITTGKIVEKGTSGGISLTGSLAASGGAAWIGLLAVIVWPQYAGTLNFEAAVGWLVLIMLAGLGGSLIDSLLGATIQAIYYCPACAKETERHPLHTCGNPTHLLRGKAWLNNDGVNWSCSLGGALLMIIALLV